MFDACSTIVLCIVHASKHMFAYACRQHIISHAFAAKKKLWRSARFIMRISTVCDGKKWRKKSFLISLKRYAFSSKYIRSRMNASSENQYMYGLWNEIKIGLSTTEEKTWWRRRRRRCCRKRRIKKFLLLIF